MFSINLNTSERQFLNLNRVSHQNIFSDDRIPNNNEPETPTNTPSNIINSLERFEINESNFIESNHCSICYEPLNNVCVKLRCEHSFHEHCITNWLNRRNTCPLCRHPVYDVPQNNNETTELHIHSSNIQFVNQFKVIHFVFQNGIQLDTKWSVLSKAHELIQFIKHFQNFHDIPFKIKFNIGHVAFSFSTNDSFDLLNTSLNDMMIYNHTIMRIHEF